VAHADRVSFVLTADDAACRDACTGMFAGVPGAALTRDELRPSAPFAGPLFTTLAGRPRGSVLALVTPVTATHAGALRPGELVPIADHVNLEPGSPLSGRWPASLPRDFPSMTGIYQPAHVRRAGGPRVYSSGVVAAGVADARRLTRFEARAIRQGGWPILSDSLVPAAIVAAYYGLRLAACGLVQASRDDRE
jgi:hypothetical protein